MFLEFLFFNKAKTALIHVLNIYLFFYIMYENYYFYETIIIYIGQIMIYSRHATHRNIEKL